MGKKSKKDKKERKEKKRKRSSSTDETSDEEYTKKREAARLAKKVERHLKKHTIGAAGYSNEDNPFGDANLTDRFVWGKKIEKQLQQGEDVKNLTAHAEKRRQQERLDEIDKVKRRREEREREREAMKEELELIQRERTMAEAVELERKEEEFHLEQAKIRARQRLAAGRPKAIDLLTNNLFLLDGFDATEEDPSGIITGLTLYQLRELKKDLIEYSDLDSRDSSHTAFWQALATVTNKELDEATKQEEIDRARMRGLPPAEKYNIQEAGWHSSIDADVAVMLAGKTSTELQELENTIQSQLDNGDFPDPEYWVAVLKRLDISRAKAVLREFHADMMQQQLAKMMSGVDVHKAMGWKELYTKVADEEDDEYYNDEKPVVKKEEEQPSTVGVVPEPVGNAEEIQLPDDEAAGDAELEALAAVDNRPQQQQQQQQPSRQGAEEQAARGEPQAWEDLSDTEQDRINTASDTTDLDYSPRPVPPEHVVGQDVVPEDEDLRVLNMLRMQVKYREAERFRQAAAVAGDARAGSTSADADKMYREMVANPRAAGHLLGATSSILKHIADSGPQSTTPLADLDANERQFRAAASNQMGDLNTSGDAPFGGEVNIDSQVYWWHEKYKPRKPKYFNRVHTGYEWNKYNKTHYDADNPPPKTVQGYKFNIFYPDLIDKVKAPSYKVEKDPSSPDGSTCILRFTAGPPYEDIAFKIVNKEWEYNHKRGFKCVFDRGILHLYFNFKRQFYRR